MPIKMETRYVETDIAELVYWAATQDDIIPLRFVLIRNGEYSSLLELLKTNKYKDDELVSLVTSCTTILDIVMLLYMLGPNKKTYKRVNTILSNNDLKTYADLTEFQTAYDVWKKQYDKEVEQTQYKAELIQESLEYFESYDKVPDFFPSTKFVIEASELSFTTNNSSITGDSSETGTHTRNTTSNSSSTGEYGIADGPLLFDSIESNKTVPYIKYITNDAREIYKNYKTYLFDADRHKFSENKNSIYAVLMLEDDTEVEFRFNIENNFILVQNVIGYIDYTDEIKVILAKYFHIQLGEPRVTNIGGQYQIWPTASENARFKELNVNVFDFLHYIMLDDVASQFLYEKEEIKFFGEKKRMDLHYNKLFERFNTNTIFNHAMLGFNLNLKTTNGIRKINTISPKTGELVEGLYPKNTVYYNVNIKNVLDIDDVNDFMYVFQAILYHYGLAREAYRKLYPSLLGAQNYKLVSIDTLSVKEFKGVGKKMEGDILSMLKERTKEYGILPSKNYARKVTGRLYPSLVYREEFEGVDEDRQIMRFPLVFPPNRRLFYYLDSENKPVFLYSEDLHSIPEGTKYYKFPLDLPPFDVPARLYYHLLDSGRLEFSYNKQKSERGWTRYKGDFPPGNIYFYCEHDEGRFPGVSLNVRDNKKRYPYIPSCFKQDQIGNPESLYSKYFLRGQIPSEIKENVGNLEKIFKSTGKTLDPGRKGTLPRTLLNLFSLIPALLKPKGKGNMAPFRMGTIRSLSSLLHCVLIFIEKGEYLDLASNMEREEYVVKMRARLARKVYPELLAQELYDVFDDIILADLANSEIYLNPSLYYRALEEIYNINIYVFGPDKTLSSNKREANVEKAMMKIPRYQLFHTRPVRADRRTMIVYEHEGSDIQGLQYPQCELVLGVPEDESMAQLCHDILKHTLMTYTSMLSTGSLNPIDLRNRSSTSTSLDGVSKKQSSNINMQNSYNLFYDNDVMLYLPFQYISQTLDTKGKMIALNMMVIQDGVYMTVFFPPSQPLNLPRSESYFSIDVGILSKLFLDKPTSKAPDGSGFWFAFQNIPDLIFVPTEGNGVYHKVPKGEHNPLISEGGTEDSITDSILKYRLMTNIMKTLIHLMYAVSDYENADDFLLDDNVEFDEEVLYNFEKVQYNLSLITDYKKLLKYIEEVTSGTLVRKGKLIMRNYTLRDRLLYDLKEWIVSFGPNPIVAPGIIEGYYDNIRNFIEDQDSVIFENEDMYKKWYKSHSEFNSLYHIHYIIGNPHSSIPDPFIFFSADLNRYYLVSNTGEDRDKAIYKAQNWKINHSNSDAVIEYDMKDVITYIPNEGRLPIDPDVKDKLQIVEYRVTDTITKYAALLPL